MQSFPPSSIRKDGDGNSLNLKCYACEATFRNQEALRAHKIQMREEEFFRDQYLTHVYCHYCDQDFVTERAGKVHWDQFHAEKQDINCPGCNMHFVHFSAFVHHVEFHECPVVFQQTAAARCQKELDFARALERIDQMGRGMNRTKDFTTYLGGYRENTTTNHLPARSAITNGPSDPWPSEDPWPSLQPRVPNAPPVPEPTKVQTMQLQLFDKQENDTGWQKEEKAMMRARGVVQADPDDPKGHNFDPERLFCPYTKMYKCPRCKKGKGFKSWPALQQHMVSAAHAFTKNVACPACKDTFKHLFSLAAHVESADKKCNLKHSDIFEIFLGQLTWNLVEVAGKHESDGTTIFAISKEAEQQYSVSKPVQLQLTFGQQQVPASEPGTTRLQLTSGALSELEKQSDKALPHFKAPQQPIAVPWQSDMQQQQPQQTCTQTRSVHQNQAQAQHQYQQQFPSLQQRQQRQQPQSSQAKPQGRHQSQPRPTQVQQPSQPLAQYQPRLNFQEQTQAQRPQPQQRPVRSLGSGLTELTLAQVPAFPFEKRVNSEEAWSNDGDGDAGW